MASSISLSLSHNRLLFIVVLQGAVLLMLLGILSQRVQSDSDGPQYAPGSFGLAPDSWYTACQSFGFPKQETPADPLWGNASCLLEVERFIPHIATDKPVYRPGERMYIRVVSVDAHSERVKSKLGYLWAPVLKVVSAKGDEVATIQSEPDYRDSEQQSLVFASWALPRHLAGGDYTLRASFDSYMPHPVGERKFQVRAFRNPKLRVTVEFIGSGYGSEDEVHARVVAVRTEDGTPAAGARATLTARVDGDTVHGPAEATLDANGECLVRFRLPKDMAEGQGALTAVARDGGSVESSSKTIPIVLQKLNVRMYPEGGPLMAGVTNRVYFEALTPTDEPVDLVGEVWTAVKGGSQQLPNRVVSEVTARHEGRGRFDLVPAEGVSYELRITKPAGVAAVLLPEAEREGPYGAPLVALRAEGSPLQGQGELTVRLTATKPGRAVATLYKREREVQSAEVTFARAGEEAVVTLGGGEEWGKPILQGACGVLRLTVQSGTHNRLQPTAERLIFRRPDQILSVEVGTPLAASGSPGAEQTVEVRVRDVWGEPVQGAMVGVAVTDVSVLGLVEDRRQAPRLPEMVYLEADVAHLEDVSAYLAPGKEGEEALDLLLGTQGWRRFLYSKPLHALGAEKEQETGGSNAGAKDAIEEDAASQKDRERAERAMGIHIPPKETLPQVQMLEMDGRAAWRPFRMGVREKNAMMPMALDMAVAGGSAEGQAAEGAIMDVAEKQDFLHVAGAEAEEERGMDEIDVVDELAEEGEGEGALQVAAVRDEPENLAVAKVAMARVAPRWNQLQRPVREYAHKRRMRQKEWESGEQTRADFTETVYWSAGTKTDAFGVVTARFQLSDSITSFAVRVDAHADLSGSGAFGLSDVVFIVSKKPFSVDAKMPLQVTAGDRILLPVLVSSATGAADVAVNVSCTSELAIVASKGRETAAPTDAGSSEAAHLRFSADGHKRHIITMDVRGVRAKASGNTQGSEARTRPRFGSASVDVQATSESRAWLGGKSFFDSLRRPLAVAPAGFPFVRSRGGVLRLGGSPANLSGQIPSDSQASSISMSVTAYPSPVANIAKALEALVTEPYGCFEQASATVYPNIMVQQYLRSHGDVAEAGLLARSYAMLEKGFALLSGYEVDKSGGYDWFGTAPAHEALTAYGLLEFLDLATVFPVPPEMIARTKKWLLGRKDDGQKGFKLDPRQLDSFGGAPRHISNAYIIWALTCANLTEGLEKQIEGLHELAKESKDPYHITLAAGSLFNVGRPAAAHKLAESLRRYQRADGAVREALTSITSSGGESLVAETTALAILAWLGDGGEAFAPNVRRAVEWLAATCQDGRYGSTQATVLSLKALLAYDATRQKRAKAVALHLSVGGVRIQTLSHEGKSVGAISFVDAGDRLRPGAPFSIQLHMESSSEVAGIQRALAEDLSSEPYEMPYSIQVRYHATMPPAVSRQCPVSVEVALPELAVVEGDLGDVSVTVLNAEDKTQPMTLVIVGLPGGFEPRHEQLKELMTKGAIAFYEVRGQEVVLYWRFLAPLEKKVMKLEVVAAVPGTYTGPASRAYLYYADECKSWASPLKCEIKPRD